MRLFRRRPASPPETRPAATTPEPMPVGPVPIEGRAGAISAARAVAFADVVLAPFDDERRLVGIASDTSLLPDGRCRGWDLFYDLPSRGSGLNAVIAPCAGEEEVDTAPLCLELRETPLLAPHSDEVFVRKIAAELGMTFEQFEEKRRELVMSERPPALPMPFRDSTEAIADFADRIDLVSGPSDVALSARRHRDGRVEWELAAGGTVLHASFAS